ncbi:MAG: guanylate kinase [Acidimicrobiia bacterium]|nr:guanylate kinase [Acidimicrobiia bacterium]
MSDDLLNNGKLIVIAGPSGVGKGTLVSELMKKIPELYLSISTTTRAPRPHEIEGKSYYFLSEEEFLTTAKNDGMLEYFEVYGDWKGTPKAPIEEHIAKGQNVVLELDVQGALKVKDLYPNTFLIFVKAPSEEVQRRRLLQREDPTMTPESLDKRLAAAAAEENLIPKFSAMVINDDLARALSELTAIVKDHISKVTTQ